ncbi:hypothetical protein SUBVAR_06857 [Subdoligranulum variabile DSM 15176]|uniref:Uncharacterized protein n=1 Tax=Subdoligranulum variabile DSM 15176 TaxID=411471 RepID=D1PR30_9FIRM|nr:hypothetical protein SUBVAR_06857 [Subdoligranulum variabile DSM 15176]
MPRVCGLSDNRSLQETPHYLYCTRRWAIVSREKLPGRHFLQPHTCQKYHGVFGQPAACLRCPRTGTL